MAVRDDTPHARQTRVPLRVWKGYGCWPAARVARVREGVPHKAKQPSEKQPYTRYMAVTNRYKSSKLSWG